MAEKEIATRDVEVLVLSAGESAQPQADSRAPVRPEMDDMSGLDVLDLLHHLRPELPVIVITADPLTDMNLDARAHGVFDYITKPFEMAQVRRALFGVDGTWDAAVRVRRVLSEDKPHVERVTCRKVTPGLAERVAAIYAQRWVDLRSGPA